MAKRVSIPRPIKGFLNYTYYTTIVYRSDEELEWLKREAAGNSTPFGVFPESSQFVFYACNRRGMSPSTVAEIIHEFMKKFKRKGALYVVYTETYYPVEDDGCVNGGVKKITAKRIVSTDLLDLVK